MTGRGNRGRSGGRRDGATLGLGTRVADCIELWPETLDVLLEAGFEPLRSAVARKTVARLFTLRQAAEFGGLDPERLLARLRAAAHLPEAADVAPAVAEDDGVGYLGGSPVPRLEGDVRVLGLVPCPLRSLLAERFDGFVRRLTADSGARVAWWLAGEGPGTRDVRSWLSALARQGRHDEVPDVLCAVGTELFCDRRYGRSLFDAGVLGPVPGGSVRRPELAALGHPEGLLYLQFAVCLVWACRPERLPGGRLPRRWADLADPALRGEVALPSPDLPVVPDLLGALHAHLGKEAFVDLALNLSTTLHPARSAPRRGRDEIPGVVVLPHHFARSSEAAGAVAVTPEDGAIAVPAYLAVRRDASPEALRVVEFLRSPEWLAPLWEHGGFYPDHPDVAAALPGGRMVTRPWESVRAPGAEERSDQRVRLVRGGGA